jgi:hypothetical protein
MLWLEYIGAALCIIAQLQRSLHPKWILVSFITSTISAIILSFYLIHTAQYGLLCVEIVFICTNVVGYYKWRLIKERMNYDS